MTAPPTRAFLGEDYNHLYIGGNSVIQTTNRIYKLRDIINAIDYVPSFNIRQSMTGGDGDTDDEYLYGIVSG